MLTALLSAAPLCPRSNSHYLNFHSTLGSFAISVWFLHSYHLVPPLLEHYSVESHRLYSFVSNFSHSVLFMRFIHVIVYVSNKF